MKIEGNLQGVNVQNAAEKAGAKYSLYANPMTANDCAAAIRARNEA